MTNCPNCNAQIEENLKFCTECGTKIEQTNIQQTAEISCPKCSAKVPPNNNFCIACGAKIEQIQAYNPDKEAICPNCSKELPTDIKFCTDCGTKIEQTFSFDPNQDITCPCCSKSLPANTKFCTDCGTKIKQFSNSSNKKIQNIPLSDETVNSIKKTGNNLAEGIGGFINKATSKGGTLDKFASSIGDAIEGKNKDYSNGYLQCSKCGGYYKLQPGESPDDFGSCQCGGKLRYVITILQKNR